MPASVLSLHMVLYAFQCNAVPKVSTTRKARLPEEVVRVLVSQFRQEPKLQAGYVVNKELFLVSFLFYE